MNINNESRILKKIYKKYHEDLFKEKKRKKKIASFNIE